MRQATSEPRRVITAEEKLNVLQLLQNKSVRDGQKELQRLAPVAAMPKGKERVINDSATEVRFTMTNALRMKLESVRALLGTKGKNMSYADFFDAMSDMSLAALDAKRFGKKRVQGAHADPQTKKTVPSTQAVIASADSASAKSGGRQDIWGSIRCGREFQRKSVAACCCARGWRRLLKMPALCAY